MKAILCHKVGPLVSFCVLVFSASEKLVGQQRGLEPSDYYDMVSVGDVEISPDGDLVAFTVTRILEDENTRRREVWMQVLRGGRPEGKAYRFTDPTADSHSPVWSPDGQLLSFTSNREGDPNTTWFLRVGGPGGEAFHIEGVRGTPVYSRDGQWIAYLASPVTSEGQERDGWVAPDAITNTLDLERFDGRVITSTRYKRDGILTFQKHFSTNVAEEIYLVDADGGTPRRLTELPFDKSGVSWSSNGRVIFFSGDREQNDESNSQLTDDLWAVRINDGAVASITGNPGSETAPTPSPDGTRLVFLSNPERGSELDVMIAEIGSDGSLRAEPENLTSGWDLDPGTPEWTADGTGILFTAGIGGNRQLFRVATSGGPVTQVTTGDRQIVSISLSSRGDMMAYASTDAVSPTELFLARGDGTGETRITDLNDDWLDGLSLVSPERLTWLVGDSVEIEGWLVKPVGYVPGREYPLILKIHGGPHGAYGNTFFPTFHVLSASGFFVLYSNPRGSGSYGHDFKYATRGRWGLMDSEDFLTGVDTALEEYPDIDGTRIGVSGGSYGGFMTNWLSATSDRFSAAVTSRSITNWESWWGTSDAQGLTAYEFYGHPWERRELYRRLSPISYVENVTIPTLIIHSENDYRTPIGDGEQWFMALKKLGVPVEMVRYPRSSHGLSRTGEPWLLVDRLERMRSWFLHWLVEEPFSMTSR
ncbi:MAG: hypothetical protein CME22_00115 [Gemmatimonadetes bacterium]|nr:hypothetical protein [Gemmatimonadota bacterium]